MRRPIIQETVHGRLIGRRGVRIRWRTSPIPPYKAGGRPHTREVGGQPARENMGRVHTAPKKAPRTQNFLLLKLFYIAFQHLAYAKHEINNYMIYIDFTNNISFPLVQVWVGNSMKRHMVSEGK